MSPAGSPPRLHDDSSDGSSPATRTNVGGDTAEDVSPSRNESPHATIMTERLNVVVRSDGRKQVNQYVLLETIGKGSFGKVKFSLDTESGIHYAVKIMDKALMKRKRVLGRSSVSDQLANLRREIDVMIAINHINIVHLHEIIDDPNSDKIYLVMEHLVRGPVINLHDDNCIPLPESVCKSYLRDVLSGLEYLHSLRIAHRDIKPDNLLLSKDGIVKIADFGVSVQFNDSDDYIRATAGSLAFMAPEMCLSEGAAYRARATDVWSAGVSLYAMLFGKVPFTASSTAELYDTISRAKLEWPRPISPALEMVLRGMLEKDPTKRITLDRLKEDPWLTDNGAHRFGADRARERSSAVNISPPESDRGQDSPSALQEPNSKKVLLTLRTNSAMSRQSSHPDLIEVDESPSPKSSMFSPVRRLYRCLTAVLTRFLSKIRRRSSRVHQE